MNLKEIQLLDSKRELDNARQKLYLTGKTVIDLYKQDVVTAKEFVYLGEKCEKANKRLERRIEEMKKTTALLMQDDGLLILTIQNMATELNSEMDLVYEEMLKAIKDRNIPEIKDMHNLIKSVASN